MKTLKQFEGFKIRHYYDEENDKWYFSVIDVVAALTEQVDYKKAQSYWTTLKSRLKKEKSQVVTNCDKLKLIAADGKKWLIRNIWLLIKCHCEEWSDEAIPWLTE